MQDAIKTSTLHLTQTYYKHIVIIVRKLISDKKLTGLFDFLSFPIRKTSLSGGS